MFNWVRFRLRLGYPGSLLSLYRPTFHVTPVDFCIIFQCNLYLSCTMSRENKIVSKLFQIVSNCFRISKVYSESNITKNIKVFLQLFRIQGSRVEFCSGLSMTLTYAYLMETFFKNCIWKRFYMILSKVLSNTLYNVYIKSYFSTMFKNCYQLNYHKSASSTKLNKFPTREPYTYT